MSPDERLMQISPANVAEERARDREEELWRIRCKMQRYGMNSLTDVEKSTLFGTIG